MWARLLFSDIMSRYEDAAFSSLTSAYLVRPSFGVHHSKVGDHGFSYGPFVWRMPQFLSTVPSSLEITAPHFHCLIMPLGATFFPHETSHLSPGSLSNACSQRFMYSGVLSLQAENCRQTGWYLYFCCWLCFLIHPYPVKNMWGLSSLLTWVSWRSTVDIGISDWSVSDASSAWLVTFSSLILGQLHFPYSSLELWNALIQKHNVL